MNEPISIVKCCDCMDFMAEFEDKFFDLAIVDPPYGIRDFTEKWKGGVNWNDKIPNKKYFDELFRISKNQIICGGNYYTEFLKPTKSWIVWNKEVGIKSNHVECELFWSSLKFPTYILKETWNSGWYNQNQEHLVHPCQKPIKLYKKLIHNHAKESDKILDTHLGSQSSRIAAYKMGFDFWGCEIDEDYFRDGCKRFEIEKSQQTIKF